MYLFIDAYQRRTSAKRASCIQAIKSAFASSQEARCIPIATRGINDSQTQNFPLPAVLKVAQTQENKRKEVNSNSWRQCDCPRGADRKAAEQTRKRTPSKRQNPRECVSMRQQRKR
jgi:hypothetical protein